MSISKEIRGVIVTSSPHQSMGLPMAKLDATQELPIVVPVSTTELATEELCCRGSISTGVDSGKSCPIFKIL